MRTEHHSAVQIVRGHPFLLSIVLATLLLGGVNWILRPDEAQRWLRGMLMLPALCIGLTLWYWHIRRSAPASDAGGHEAVRRYFGDAVKILIVAIGFWKITQFGLLIWVHVGERGSDLEIERRILGLATAAVFILIGDRLPKILTPLAMLPLHLAERVTRARRFIGAVWVVLGVGLAIAFLGLPIPIAKSLQLGAGIVGVLTIMSGIVWMNIEPPREKR